ncbi:MAG: glycogen/starch/alpha-glucan phosphorylase [Candidatus Cloacimonetes bacterium]|nr:glycogen/starch/alpha-glucan phosphorylase [Candidatus Cloacimonadota bacterium]
MNKDLSTLISSHRLSVSAQEIVNRFINHLKYTQGKDQFSATPLDCYQSFANAVSDLMLDRWLQTQPTVYRKHGKRVYYLSLEYLIGRSLSNAILNLDIGREAQTGLKQMGFDLSELEELEWDAGLGNGGLGRLAACFLDSMSTLGIPAYGYGIRYEYGIFRQHVHNNEQIETPDNWLRYGSVWEVAHPEHLFPVFFGGHVTADKNDDHRPHVHWHHNETVMAMAYDYLVPGYRNDYVNTLRLWSAKASRDFDLRYFNEGNYIDAVAGKNHSEMISKVLYPKDDTISGKELRLKQEYFFVSATLQDILRRFAKKFDDLRQFPDQAAIQLNDTHPAIAVAELMRLLVDVKRLDWATAWDITQNTMAYTNHTILPEALEKWRIDLFERLLPRHLQIIYEINQRFLDRIRLDGVSDNDTLRRLSIIEEYPVRSVRMANLAVIGSHQVNGVSELHSDLVKTRLFPEFNHLFPERFTNVTNGITPRRWLMLANPALSALISEAIGDDWKNDLNKLEDLRAVAGDGAFLDQWAKVKMANKLLFIKHIADCYHHQIDPDSIFDFQAKRIHEYKRQLLNALHILHLSVRIKSGKAHGMVPHTFFFSGKAAPGYFAAKLIIRLICALGEYIIKDKQLARLINVIFLPNYRVSLAEQIMPAAELSQQISTAGTEASGTGNMKFALNGALTVGTLDGANIEIRQAVGADNFFLFGMTEAEVEHLKAGGYHPYDLMHRQPDLQAVFDFINDDMLSPMQPALFRPLVELLLYQGDQYCIIADFADYARVMKEIDAVYHDQKTWNRMSILNVAGMGRFSSDEAIRQYARKIWNVSVPVGALSFSAPAPANMPERSGI